MKLISAPDNMGLFFRQTDESKTIEFGVWRVMFGYRVRAGFVNEASVCWDWCAGNDLKSLSFLYTIAEQILLSREVSRAAFEGVPEHSDIKPYFNDFKFVGAIMSAIPGGMTTTLTRWTQEQFDEAAQTHLDNILQSIT